MLNGMLAGIMIHLLWWGWRNQTDCTIWRLVYVILMDHCYITQPLVYGQ